MSAMEAEISRLSRKHSDIAKHGVGALVLMDEKAALLERRRVYCSEHGVKCFKCGTGLNDWARCGKTNGRYWGICQPCVRQKRTS